MLRTLTLLLLSLLLGACGPESPPQSPVQPRLKVGDLFPILEVLDLQRQKATTAQFMGRPQVINIWATWCAPCRKELPALQRMHQAFERHNVAVIGISVDNDDHLVREFLIDRKIHFPNYLDADMHIANKVLGVTVFPATYLIAADGTIRDIIPGERDWDADLQRAQVLRALVGP